MLRSRATVARIRSAIVYVAVAVAAAWLVADAIADIWGFFYENRGIDFYRQKPYLIALCVILAVAVGLCIKAIAGHKRSRGGTQSGGKSTDEGSEHTSGSNPRSF